MRVGVNRLLSIGPALGYPYMAHVSPAGVCNLHCALCPVNDPAMRGKGLLPLATFRRFLDQVGPYLLHMILWGWGEPLLNPELPQMCADARARDIVTVTSTNLNHLDRPMGRELVACGLDAMIVALDEAHAFP